MILTVIALYPLLSKGPVRLWAIGLALVAAAIAFIAPRLLAPFNSLWTRFGHLLHDIISPITLGLLYFAFITPGAWLLRGFGRTGIALGFDKTAATYWHEKHPSESQSHSFERPY